MSRIKIFFAYLLAGPMVGGLLVALAIAVTVPFSSVELIGLIATCVFFAYPFGALAAACSGLTHIAMHGRVGAYAIAAATALAGLLGHVATLALFGKGLTVLAQTPTAAELAAFAAPPLVSALIICYAILRCEQLGRKTGAMRPSFSTTL